ncbi:MAG TPA: hypothetical protein VFV38_05295, partial [Ktedonobacteraceae bacterium]|nr:hypothetical protein [Ktedonobacteraceae bacterium]
SNRAQWTEGHSHPAEATGTSQARAALSERTEITRRTSETKEPDDDGSNNAQCGDLPCCRPFPLSERSIAEKQAKKRETSANFFGRLFPQRPALQFSNDDALKGVLRGASALSFAFLANTGSDVEAEFLVPEVRNLLQCFLGKMLLSRHGEIACCLLSIAYTGDNR